MVAEGITHSTVAGNIATEQSTTAQRVYYTAYTYPVTQGAISITGTFGNSFTELTLSVFDSLLGPKEGVVSFNTSPYTINGDFAGVIAGDYFGQLCTETGSGGLQGKYVYTATGAVEVPVSELKGKNFVEYENCEESGTSTFNQDGSLTFTVNGESEPETVSAADVFKLFSKEGWDEGNEFSKAKAYKFYNGNQAFYYYLNNGNDVPFPANGTGDNYVVLGVEFEPR